MMWHNLLLKSKKGNEGQIWSGKVSKMSVIQEFMTHLKQSAVSRFPDSDQVESKWKVC